jgi:hypothetical protein
MAETTPTQTTDTYPQLVCFSCGTTARIEELLLVDMLINSSPCFKGLSETFARCGDDPAFHGNVVNCCASCYAAIVQTDAPCEESTRTGEIANVARMLRDLGEQPGLPRVLGIPATAIATLERLLENLVAVGATPDILLDELGEALYCKTSPLYGKLC